MVFTTPFPKLQTYFAGAQPAAEFVVPPVLAASSVTDSETATSFVEISFEQNSPGVLLQPQTSAFMLFGTRPPKSNSETTCASLRINVGDPLTLNFVA